MSKNKIIKKVNTYNKLGSILGASKLKVLHQLFNIKKAATHNHMLALLSKKIFEHAKNNMNFDSEIYSNNFNSGKDINIMFISENQTLSHASERTISSFLKNKNDNDFNIIVSDSKNEDERLKDFRLVNIETLISLSYEINHRYVSKKYDRVNIYSSLSEEGKYNTILPMIKLNENVEFKYKNLINKQTKFSPSVDLIIEKSYLDYVSGLLKYYYIYGKYTDLKNTLLKHETSITHIEDNLEDLNKKLNKIRKSKITQDILLAHEGAGGDND